MPSLIKLVPPIGLCLLALLGASPAAHADESKQAKSRLERLTGELGQTLGTLRKRLFDRDTLRAQLEQADRKVAQINSRLLSAERQAAALAQNLAALRMQQEAARIQIEHQRQVLARSLALAARSGSGDRLKLLLKQQDPALLARQLRYQRYVADAQTARLATLRGQLDAYLAREGQIAADAEKLAADRSELQEQRRALDRLRQEREVLLARAERDVTSGERRVRAIEQDQRELKALLARIAQREAQARRRPPEPEPESPTGPASEKTPIQAKSAAGPLVGAIPTPSLPGERFSARRSRLPWPLSGQLKARFGTARASGRTRWDGVVIASKPGSTVRSIHAGKVVYADVLGGYGLLVIVDHGEGYLSLYGYNDAILKRPGQRVAAGDPIASVGDRGSASGLYFEIRHRGQPVNPTVWCGR